MDLTKRYGNLKNGVNDIKNHRWFSTTEWIAVYQKRVCAYFVQIALLGQLNSLKIHKYIFILKFFNQEQAPLIPRLARGPGDTTQFMAFEEDDKIFKISQKPQCLKDFEDF